MFKDCFYCTERTPACHSTCEKYLKDRKELDRRKMMRRAQLSLDPYFIDRVDRFAGIARKKR